MTRLKLKDFDVEKLSDETLDIITELTCEIKKASGKSFRFNDPFLLPRIHRRVRQIKDPEITAIYKRLKTALIENVVSTGGAALMSEEERKRKLDFSQFRSIRKKVRESKKRFMNRYSELEVSVMNV